MNSVKQFGHEKRGVKKIEDFFFESNKLSLANWSDWVGGLDWKKRETEDKREKIEEKGKKNQFHSASLILLSNHCRLWLNMTFNLNQKALRFRKQTKKRAQTAKQIKQYFTQYKT